MREIFIKYKNAILISLVILGVITLGIMAYFIFFNNKEKDIDNNKKNNEIKSELYIKYGVDLVMDYIPYKKIDFNPNTHEYNINIKIQKNLELNKYVHIEFVNGNNNKAFDLSNDLNQTLDFKYESKSYKLNVVFETYENEFLENLMNKYDIFYVYSSTDKCEKIQDCNLVANEPIEDYKYNNEDTVSITLENYNKENFDIMNICPDNSIKCKLNITDTGLNKDLALHYRYSFFYSRFILKRMDYDTLKHEIDEQRGAYTNYDNIKIFENKYIAVIENIGVVPIPITILKVFDTSLNEVYKLEKENLKFSGQGIEYNEYSGALPDESDPNYNPNLIVGIKYKQNYTSNGLFNEKEKVNDVKASEIHD